MMMMMLEKNDKIAAVANMADRTFYLITRKSYTKCSKSGLKVNNVKSNRDLSVF